MGIRVWLEGTTPFADKGLFIDETEDVFVNVMNQAQDEDEYPWMLVNAGGGELNLLADRIIAYQVTSDEPFVG